MTIITIRVQEKDDALHIFSHLMDLSVDDELEGDFEVDMTGEED
jgi:hypothetical protein